MRKRGSKNLKRCIYCYKTEQELDGIERIRWEERSAILCGLCWEKIGDYMGWFRAFGCWCRDKRK
ncbi:MAG: hypothetical protein AMJ78_00780 [Omnitrophica WOR_2 bacterium SM23_29]|nr:MAG: hypothetical protein AMJ78_00780 [Omnitrophica WOR_2 bacterium SM23_29]